MYPRNNATPPRIAIGAVVQIADGAVQTSGVSVVVRPEGGAESAGGGTITYSAASGVVYYTPTQAETNYAAFCVIAYKAACIPAQVTVVPTASETAGVAVLDSASVTAVQSGLATAASIAAEAVKTAAIQAKTDNLPSDPADQSLIVAATDAVMTRLGSPAGASIAADIAAIDGGGGGGGDATLAKQEEILTAVESVVDTVAAYAARMALEVQLRGFPNVICRNADYLIATESEIRITVEDLTGTAITEIAGTPVASLSWLFGMGTEQDPALIAGTCTWDAGTDELVIEIAKAATAGKQTGSLTWQIGVSIGAARRWLGGGTTRLIERQF